MPDNTGQRLVELSQGVLVEEDLLGVVQKIQELDPNLIVQYLDPDKHGDLTDAPFRIMEVCPDGYRRLVFSVWQLDDRVIDRLRDADTLKHDILGLLDSKNELMKKNQEQRYKEELAAVNEMAADVLKSPKDTYSATDPVTGVKRTFTSKPRD